MTSLRRKCYILLAFSCIPLLWSCSLAGVIPCLKPGDKAPGFSVQTTEGLLSYNTDQASDIRGPLVVVAFTNESSFLENLFADPKRMVVDLFDHSPNNAHYLFLFYDNAALEQNQDASQRLKILLIKEIYQYHNQKWLRYNKEMKRVKTLSNYRKKSLRQFTFLQHWKSKLHFAKFPVHMLGNWIPRVLSQWYCSGTFCGLDQIAIENQKGDVLNVFRRLDARYTWLPSIKKLTNQKKRFVVVYVHNACAKLFSVVVKGALALVYSGHTNCSTFHKVKNAQSNGALGVIVYSKPAVYLEELNCHRNECETELNIPATIIHNDDGYSLKEAVLAGSMYARFQTTPSDMFTFGIDGQGRVRETSWSLYPSMRFLAYHAQWFNYVTDAIRNESGDVRLISIFKDHLIQSSQGVTTDVSVPDYRELLLYQNVEVDMSLTCPKTGPDACTHWDHVIKLLVSCDPNEKPGHELTRWIMAYGRRSSSWITPIRAVLPLLKANSTITNKCSFTVITEASVMPWIVTVNIRLSQKIKPNMNFTTWREIEKNLVSVEVVDLFTGCFFDENCNKKYRPKFFKVPKKIARVKLVATITGHGRDNNNCARACLTTHRFIINNIRNSTKTRILKNTGSSPGCESDFIDPNNQMNTQKMWLRGRQPWCDGQEVVPWEVDVTAFVRFGGVSNFIEYRAFYNGTDPRPTQDPGTIVMSSYLVYYVYEDLV